MSLPLIVTAAAVLALPRVQYTEAQRTQQIKSLPGAPQVDFKMFSGYVNIGVRGKLFFWFVESQSATAATDPVLLWTNGGPGCSGLVGFLTENGPFRPTEKGNLTLNPTAWNTLANMVYIEQPVGVGFSVASGKLKYSDAQAAEDNLNFLKGFFKLFPQYDHNRFYLTSESYGGHYLPTLAEAIVEDGTLHSFAGFLVGNPITWLTYVNYGRYGTLYGHQLLPKPLWDAYEAAGCRSVPGLDPGTPCVNITAEMDDLTKDLDPYGLDFPKCNGSPLGSGRFERTTLARAIGRASGKPDTYPYYPSNYQPCTSDWATAYLSRKDVQAALHATPGGPTWAGNWSACANIDYSQEDVAAPMMPIYQRLLAAGLNMTIMSGDDDTVCSTLGTQQFIWDLGLDVRDAWRPWYMEDGPKCPGEACKQVAGFKVQYADARTKARLSLVTVHGAGHLVPATRPAQGLEVLRQYLSGIW